MFELNPDYSKRDCSLPPGCKDLIDVLQNSKEFWWKRFFDTHWKLIYETALKAGLTHGEARKVIQEVMVGVERQTPPKLNDNPANESFKAWVMRLTQWRIRAKLRKKGRLTQ